MKSKGMIGIVTASRTVLILAALILLWVSSSPAALADRVYEEVLPNGLKVIILEDRKAPVVTFQVWYRVGSRNEEWGKTGLSHMLEHMMFKGTLKTGPEEFSRLIQENGGNDNAFTSSDYTAYFTNISSARILIPLELEADRMANLVLREEDFRTERMVVIEERRLRTEDNPQAFLVEQLDAAAFQVHPYRWPIIGWMADLEALTLQDLKDYYRTYYNPANAFIVVVGDVTKEDLLPSIRKAFASIPAGVPPRQERTLESPQMGERRIVVKREARLPYIIMAHHVPNLSHPDSYVLEVIEAILSKGKSSRLYVNLVRGKQIALTAGADHSLLSRDPNLFYLDAEPMPGKDPAALEEALNREIERLQNEPVPEQELVKAKNQLEASFVYSQDSLFAQAMVLARHEISAGWRSADNYLPSIRKVTPDDIMRVAKRYLNPDNRTTALLIPLAPREGKTPDRPSEPRGKVVR